MPKPKRHHESVSCPEVARVAYYLRYSNRNQSGSTIEKQRMNCAAFQACHPGWYTTTELEYAEPAKTAKYDDIDKRPVFARLLEDAKMGLFDVVIVDSVDRWGRAEAAQFTSLGILRDAGVYWATADGEWNSQKIRQSGHAQAFAISVSLTAQMPRDTSKKVSDGKINRARHGYHANSLPPFGYRRAAPITDGTGRIARRDLEPDPTYFPVLATIAELRMQGMSCGAIAAELNRMGYRYPYAARGPSRMSIVQQDDRPFLTSTIKSIVTNPFYVEFMPGSGLGTVVRGRRKSVADTPELLQGRHLAAWDRATWERMQQVARQLNHAPNAAPRHRHLYPLAGIITCAQCQLPMRSQTKQRGGRQKHEPGTRYYCCRRDLSTSPRSINRCTSKPISTACDVAEDVFGDLLARLTAHNWETQLEAFLDETDGTEQAPDRRAQLEEAQRRLNVQYRLQAIDDGEYERETKAIQTELRMLPTPLSAERRKEAARHAAGRIADIALCWRKAPLADKQQMATLLLQPEGLWWDHAQHRIIGIMPHGEFLPTFAVALGWRVEDEWLWRTDDAYQREA